MSLLIKDLSFSYGKNKIFTDFNIKLENGINVLLGANGSGKTTLFKLLATIMEPSQGSIELNSISFRSKEYQRNIAYIPQVFDVYPRLTVREFLEYVASVKFKFSQPELKTEIEKAAESADITDFLGKKMKSLSEGMKKRVGIAQALIGDVPLIIADEPTAGLDPEQRNKFNMVLKKITHDKIILISTHIIEDIKEYYDNILILSDGAPVFNGSYSQLMNSLNNRVAQITVSIEELGKYEKEYKIISKSFDDEKATLKAVVDRPAEGMELIDPTITDIWTYYR